MPSAKRGVGADADRHVPVGDLRRSRAARIDHHELHAALADLPRPSPRNARWWRTDRRPSRSPDRTRPPIPDRRRRSAPTVASQAASHATVAHRAGPQPAGAHARGTARSAGRGSSGPDARCSSSRAAPAGPIRAMMDFQRAVISSSAASQVIGANLPSPLAPMRRSGVARRSGECTSSASRLTLAQAKPAVNGWSGSPSTRTTRPFSTCASSEHMSGQSCAQTTRMVSTPCLRSMVAGADGTPDGRCVIGHVAAGQSLRRSHHRAREARELLRANCRLPRRAHRMTELHMTGCARLLRLHDNGGGRGDAKLGAGCMAAVLAARRRPI